MVRVYFNQYFVKVSSSDSITLSDLREAPEFLDEFTLLLSTLTNPKSDGLLASA